MTKRTLEEAHRAFGDEMQNVSWLRKKDTTMTTNQGWQPIETALTNCRYLVGVAGSQVMDVAIFSQELGRWCYFNPSSRRAKVLPYHPTHCYSASILPAPPAEEDSSDD
jgi:hypothetical protein